LIAAISVFGDRRNVSVALNAAHSGIERDLPPADSDDGQSQRLAAPKGRFD
jgi:hypothetical protein